MTGAQHARPAPRSYTPRRGVLLLGALLALRATAARAYHDEQTRSLEESAYILRHGEWQLGLLQLGVGLWRLQLSTRTMPWILGAALKTAAPNLRVDAIIVDRKGFTLSLNAATYYLNSKNLSDVDPVLHVFLVPVGGALSFRINDRHTLSASAHYLRIVTDSQPNEEEDLEFQSGQLADNFQLRASWEWRLSRVSALLSTLRYLPYQGDPVFSTTAQVDERTTVTVDGEVNTESMQNSLAGSVSGVFSWKHFNLRAGVAYGALFLAGSGLVLPLKYPYPELNFYWRL
jgi:hypothetical protein